MSITRRCFLQSLSPALILPLQRLSNESARTVTLRRLSWAGVSVESATTSLFLDPWITPAIWDGAWKEPIAPLQPRNARRSVLITHLHNDHFDPAALRELIAERGQVICHTPLAAGIASRGFRVRAVDLWNPEPFGDFTVVPVPASDGLGEKQVSWVVEANGRRIIHCGDTLWHGGFRLIGRSWGPFDYAFLPINGARIDGAEPKSEMPDVLTPEQAVAAAVILRARTLVPIHYGLNSSDYVEHPRATELVTAAAGKRGVAVRWLRPGEEIGWT